MSNHEYSPDSWVLIKVTKKEGSHYRVLAGFNEKPRNSDDWRISKDITSIDCLDNVYHFTCSSNSIYLCKKGEYELTSNIDHVWKALQNQKPDEVELMKSQQDWLKHEWTYME